MISSISHHFAQSTGVGAWRPRAPGAFRCQGEFDATLLPRPALLHESWSFGEGLEETAASLEPPNWTMQVIDLFLAQDCVIDIFSGAYIDFTDRFLGTSCVFSVLVHVWRILGQDDGWIPKFIGQEGSRDHCVPRGFFPFMHVEI